MTEKQMLKRFCEERLEIDPETLSADQLVEVKKSLSYGMYALSRTLKEIQREMALAFRKRFLK